jgi:uncharacterized membrane protein
LRLVVLGLAFATLVFGWIVAALNFSALPPTIPTHFDVAGRVNAYGPKSTLLLVPNLATLAFAAFLVALRINPRFYNYPFPIGANTAPAAHEFTRDLLAALSLCTMLICAAGEVAIVRAAISAPASGALAVVWATSALMLLACARYFVALKRLPKG